MFASEIIGGGDGKQLGQGKDGEQVCKEKREREEGERGRGASRSFFRRGLFGHLTSRRMRPVGRGAKVSRAV